MLLCGMDGNMHCIVLDNEVVRGATATRTSEQDKHQHMAPLLYC